MSLKKGDKGDNVKELQKILKNKGYDISVDGIFGNNTHRTVIQFQKDKGLVADGIVGVRTWAALRDNQEEQRPSGFIREPYILAPKQYKATRSRKKGICFHYAVEKSNPYRIIDIWNRDSRGAVATHFAIGGKYKDETEHDGKVIQAFSLDYYAHHVAATRTGLPRSWNTDLNSRLVGIECCTMGNLKKIGRSFYSVSESRKLHIPIEDVCILEKPWRTYQYWHKMSPKMIAALKELTIDLVKYFAFEIEEPIRIDESWFDLKWDALRNLDKRVLTTHSNFEWGKFDLMPQPELIEMLKELYAELKTLGYVK